MASKEVLEKRKGLNKISGPGETKLEQKNGTKLNFFTILNVLVFISFGFLYLALKEESVKKPKPQKEVKIKDEIFRISKYRQEEISEEDVTISRERKICLVCKGKAIRFNIFVCSICETVYCQNCVHILCNLENACWVCSTPFDPSKPSKIYTKEDLMAENNKTIIIKKKPIDDNTNSQIERS